jgi:hypothetical protein
MHAFGSKVSKRDAYVTPRPDTRFWRKFEGELAVATDASQTAIKARGSLAAWPGCPLSAKTYWEGGVDKHREVVIGGEIIRYREIGPEGAWDPFWVCTRRVGTSGGWHPRERRLALRRGRLLQRYIVDQETKLPDEMHARLAKSSTHAACMVYFDGGEDATRGGSTITSVSFKPAPCAVLIGPWSTWERS